MLKIWKKKWEKQSAQGTTRTGAQDDITAEGGSQAPPGAYSTQDLPSSTRSGTDTEVNSQIQSERPAKRRKITETKTVDIFPRETVITYDPPQAHTHALSVGIRHATQQHPYFDRHLATAQRVYDELGLCASDLWWKRALADIEDTLPLYVKSDDTTDQTTRARIKGRDTIKNFTFAMPNLNIYTLGFNVSPKFLRLFQSLKACEPVDSSFRIIVFVDSSVIAVAMYDLMKALGDLDGFRFRTLSGDETPEDQRDLLKAFSDNKFNLLIAVASTEDLEIPRASFIVRFSLPRSCLSHAYTYSHANGPHTHMVLMAEKENPVHRHILKRLSIMSEALKVWGTRTTPTSFPPASFDELEPFERPTCDRSDGCNLIEPITGDHIHFTDATLLVYRLVALQLASADNITSEAMRIDFEEVRSTIGHVTYLCRIIIPPFEFRGTAALSKAEARRHACFEACSHLVQQGLFHHAVTVPAIFHDKTPPTIPPLSEKNPGTRQYYVKRPSFWQGFSYSPMNVLYPTVINGGSINGKDGASLVLLTRLPLPDFAPFRLWFCNSTHIARTLRGAPIKVDDHQLRLFHLYTIRLLRVLTNRREVCPLDLVPYFFAPLGPHCVAANSESSIFQRLPDVAAAISWDAIEQAAAHWASPLKYGSADIVTQDVLDALIQERTSEFTRRYDSVVVRPDLTPLSSPQDRQVPGGDVNDSLLHYLQSHSTTFEGLKDEKQCIIQVKAVAHWFDHLTPGFSLPPETNYPKYIIPEVGSKSTIPASVFRTALLLPSIMHRIDEILLVKELNAKFFSHSISEELLHAAITAPSVGYEFDYDRLELLGDVVLKFIVSIYVFVTEPQDAALHGCRKELITNASLLSRAVHMELPQYIQIKPPMLKTWTVPNFKLEEPPNSKGPSAQLQAASEPAQSSGARATTAGRRKRKKKPVVFVAEPTQWIGDKAIADVCEAIIGAAYLTGGKDTALQTIKDLQIPLPRIMNWSDLVRLAVTPSPNITAPLKPGTVEAIEGIIGFKFTRPYLLAQALTHTSHKGPSYERFEFLGDAILEMLTLDFIFHWDEQLSPGSLSDLKSAMVSNVTLAALSVKCGLSKYVMTDSTELARKCEAYGGDIRRHESEELVRAQREGRSPSQYWLDIEPPKPLADIMESLLAAIVLSERFETGGAEQVFDRIFKPFFERHISIIQHPTRLLFERVHAAGCRAIELTRKESSKAGECAIRIHNILVASAHDRSPKVASRNAARAAAAFLDQDKSFFIRTCNCYAGLST